MLQQVLNTNAAHPAQGQTMPNNSQVTEPIEIFIWYLSADLLSVACLGPQLRVTSDVTSTESIANAKLMKQSQAQAFQIHLHKKKSDQNWMKMFAQVERAALRCVQQLQWKKVDVKILLKLHPRLLSGTVCAHCRFVVQKSARVDFWWNRKCAFISAALSNF